VSANENFYPYILAPKLAPAIWGGESWQCWDANAVTNGPLAGKTVADLRALLGADLLGDLDASQIFPILTKFIDARDALSVQVHPDDAYAQEHEGQRNGKTECWYVLRADDAAELVLGWTRDTDRAEYERRVADGSLGDILRRVPVKAGETFYLPAGTLHAIGKGIEIFETQQASDLTYRIFDWNRTGPDGKPRELHVRKAGDVLDYERGTRGPVATLDYVLDDLRRTALIGDRRFVVERIVATAESASLPTANRPLAIAALDRPLAIACDGGSVTLPPSTTALVPAAAKWASVASASEGDAAFLLVTPPKTPQTLPARLLAAGVPQDRVDAFMEQFA